MTFPPGTGRTGDDSTRDRKDETMPTVTPHLWFDKGGEAAADYYCSIFPDSRVLERQKFENTPSGTVESVLFEVAGQRVMILAAGPEFRLNEAFSFFVSCGTQEEVDEYWDTLVSDGGEEGPCGWLKDRYGVSWQIIPKLLDELLQDEDRERADRVMQAMLGMKKIDCAGLRAAYEGGVAA
jgi:predicted 3-demethylubiquinone-9 3-methyltransferase (glyoxalase superfamily)